PAGCALPAGFVLEEAHQVLNCCADVVLVGEYDDRRGADEAAVFLQGIEIEGDVGEAGGEDATRSAARQVGLEFVAVGHATAVFVDQLLQGDTGGRQLDARLLDTSRHGEGAQPLAAVPPLSGEPLGALLYDIPRPVEGLHVVDQGRLAPKALFGRVGGLVAGIAAPAFDRLQHCGFFTTDIGARAPA